MEVEVVTPIVAEAEVQKYTLISDDIYVRRYTSTTVPDWYRNLIENLVAQDPTITDIQGAIDYLTSVDNGYAVQLVNLENQQSSTNALLTTLQSSNSNHTALIADLQATKVDEASAQAIATNAVQSYIAGGSANAWFTSQVSTYASEIEANASSISTMSATLDGLSVSIDDISYVSIDPITGYKLGASKLGTAPDGSITGWQFADGTGVQSTFKIKATNFSVSDGTTGYTPFSIVGSDILFNGKVSFTNVTGVPTYASTYYQPTVPTGTITNGSVWFDTNDNNRAYRYNGTIWEEATTNISGLGYTKNTTFRQATEPTVMVTGDIWIDSDGNNKVYWYNGTSWVLTDPDVAVAINTNTTTIDGAKITTGTVTASQIAAGTITAGNIAADTITGSKIAAGTITASEIAASTITGDKIAANTIDASSLKVNTAWVSGIVQSSNFTTIGGAGFRLKAEAASTNADPDIYGAYIRGGTVDGINVNAAILSASKFQVNGLTAFNSAYPNNTAPMVISQFQAWSGTTDQTLTFYGASYSTGHRADRFVASTTKFMIDLTVTTSTMWGSSFAYIDVTISGSGITTQTVRVRSQNPSFSMALAASVVQQSSISYSVSFTTSGDIETPTCTFRAFGFNTE